MNLLRLDRMVDFSDHNSGPRLVRIKRPRRERPKGQKIALATRLDPDLPNGTGGSTLPISTATSGEA